MPRYVTRRRRPSAYYEDDLWSDMPLSMTVHEMDEDAEETGLLDLNGNPLFRLHDRAPMGFNTKPRKRVKAGSRRVST